MFFAGDMNCLLACFCAPLAMKNGPGPYISESAGGLLS